MDTRWKYLLLSLLVCGLVTCSNNDEDASADNGTGATSASTSLNTGTGTTPTSPCTSSPVLPPTSDTSGDVPQVECNVWAQTGCASGQKCAFVIDGINPQDNTNILGHVACIKDGTAALGEACESAFDIEVDPPVVNVDESDTCQGASVCYKNTCRSLCSDVNPVCSDGDVGVVPFPVFEDVDADVAPVPLSAEASSSLLEHVTKPQTNNDNSKYFHLVSIIIFPHYYISSKLNFMIIKSLY